MKLSVIGSSSKGNAYLLQNDREALLIDCGVRFHEIKKALNFKIGKLAGCIITHEHGDHCKGVVEAMNAGVSVYSSFKTHEAMRTDTHHRAKFLHRHIKQQIGGFEVIGYDVKHDAADPFCYLIRHADCGVVLFLTDTYYCEYNFKGLNHVIIEANYSEDIIESRLSGDRAFLRDRVLQSHMSLDTCKKTLQSYDLSQVQNIVLIHLSDGNSNEERVKREIQEATGKLVHVADAGMEIDFNLKPY